MRHPRCRQCREHPRDRAGGELNPSPSLTPPPASATADQPAPSLLAGASPDPAATASDRRRQRDRQGDRQRRQAGPPIEAPALFGALTPAPTPPIEGHPGPHQRRPRCPPASQYNSPRTLTIRPSPFGSGLETADSRAPAGALPRTRAAPSSRPAIAETKPKDPVPQRPIPNPAQIHRTVSNQMPTPRRSRRPLYRPWSRTTRSSQRRLPQEPGKIDVPAPAPKLDRQAQGYHRWLVPSIRTTFNGKKAADAREADGRRPRDCSRAPRDSPRRTRCGSTARAGRAGTGRRRGPARFARSRGRIPAPNRPEKKPPAPELRRTPTTSPPDLRFRPRGRSRRAGHKPPSPNRNQSPRATAIRRAPGWVTVPNSGKLVIEDAPDADTRRDDTSSGVATATAAARDVRAHTTKDIEFEPESIRPAATAESEHSRPWIGRRPRHRDAVTPRRRRAASSRPPTSSSPVKITGPSPDSTTVRAAIIVPCGTPMPTNIPISKC